MSGGSPFCTRLPRSSLDKRTDAADGDHERARRGEIFDSCAPPRRAARERCVRSSSSRRFFSADHASPRVRPATRALAARNRTARVGVRGLDHSGAQLRPRRAGLARARDDVACAMGSFAEGSWSLVDGRGRVRLRCEARSAPGSLRHRSENLRHRAGSFVTGSESFVTGFETSSPVRDASSSNFQGKFAGALPPDLRSAPSLVRGVCVFGRNRSLLDR